MTHVRSMKHLQMEQIHQLQKRAEGNAEQTEIGDIFQVVEMDDRSNESNAEGKIILGLSKYWLTVENLKRSFYVCF